MFKFKEQRYKEAAEDYKGKSVVINAMFTTIRYAGYGIIL